MTKEGTACPAGTPVDPARLESCQWCHRAQTTVGQGDIAASYSADRISLGLMGLRCL